MNGVGWFLSILLLTAFAGGAHAGDWQAQREFPGMDTDATVAIAVKKAERAYAKRDYENAMWHYRTTLVPVGDKFAQYMVGYMYANGEGVERDPEAAAAWFLLAAERGQPQLVEISQQAIAALSPEAQVRARLEAERLRAEYGDQQLLVRLLRTDQSRLREQTGSRSGNCDQPGRVTLSTEDQQSQSISMQHFCEVMQARIDTRKAYLEQYTVHGDLPNVTTEGMAADRRR